MEDLTPGRICERLEHGGCVFIRHVAI
jgi:hypothetical protein